MEIGARGSETALVEHHSWGEGRGLAKLSNSRVFMLPMGHPLIRALAEVRALLDPTVLSDSELAAAKSLLLRGVRA